MFIFFTVILTNCCNVHQATINCGHKLNISAFQHDWNNKQYVCKIQVKTADSCLLLDNRGRKVGLGRRILLNDAILFTFGNLIDIFFLQNVCVFILRFAKSVAKRHAYIRLQISKEIYKELQTPKPNFTHMDKLHTYSPKCKHLLARYLFVYENAKANTQHWDIKKISQLPLSI